MTDIKIESGLISVLKAIDNKIHFALGEFVDNSIQSFIENKKELEKITPGYRAKIEIFVEGSDIIVQDNCGGISSKDEERAFSLAHANPNIAQIGTYGMGMKVSACWFSDTWSVETKHFKEDLIKTYAVDVNKVAAGKMNIGPKTKKASGRSFTKISLKNCHPKAIPHTTEISILKRHLSDIYRFFLTDNILDIYYNDEKIEYNPPPIKEMPTEQDQKLISMGELKSENATKYLWVADIERIDLGKGKDGPLWAEGEVWLRETGITKGQRGFGIFWKNRLVEGVAGNPWMPGSDAWEMDDDDEKKYSIYGRSNSAINQRLEGYLHVSPNFKKGFQTNKLDWEGKRLELAGKLKERLRNIYLRDVSSRSFDLLIQAANGAWRDVKPPEPDEPPIGGDVPGGRKKAKIIDPPPPPPPPPWEPPKPGDDYVERTFKYNDIEYQTIIYLDNSDSDPYIYHQQGPDDTKNEKVKVLKIRVNTGHMFVQKYFLGGTEQKEREGLIRFAVAFVLAQEIARNTKNKNRARHVLENFEAIIKDPDF